MFVKMIYWTFSSFLEWKSSLKASISVTEKKNVKNASIGPNKFSKQYHYTPELPVEATVFATFGGGKTW